MVSFLCISSVVSMMHSCAQSPLSSCRRFHSCRPGSGLLISILSTCPFCICLVVWYLGMLRIILGGSEILYLVSPNFPCTGQLFVLSTLRVASYWPSFVCIVTFLSVMFVLFRVSFFPLLLLSHCRLLFVVPVQCGVSFWWFMFLIIPCLLFRLDVCFSCVLALVGDWCPVSSSLGAVLVMSHPLFQAL